MAQIIKADLDEMVFEGRERSYGAYKLRKNYRNYLFLGVAIVTFAFLLLTVGSWLFQSILANAESEEDRGPVNVSLSMADLPPPPPVDEETPPPPPPEKPPPPKVKTVAFKVPEPTPEEELPPEEENTIAEIDTIKEAPNIGLVDIEGEDRGLEIGEIEGEGDVPEVIKEEPKPKETEPDINAFVFVQEEPKPVNMSDIKQAIGYPQIARDAGIEGTVVIRILVDEFGNYKKHKITKQEHPILAKACEKHVGKLKFTPAIQGGKPIKFWVNIPFKFTLVN